MTWQTALDEWASALRAAGRSEGTIRLYRHYLHLVADRFPAGPWRVGTADLLAVLGRRGWSPETRKSARAAVCGFYRWAHGMGYLARDPSQLLPPVSTPPGLPRPIPERVLAKALAGASGRERLMMLLAAYAGLRCAEIAQVHREDLVEGVLVVHGKGGKVRRVPVRRPELLAALGRCEGWLFPNGLGGHLTPGHVSKLLSDALPPGWTGHTLRHRMATAGYAATRDLLAVGRVLGHSRPETTQRYVLLPEDALTAVVDGAA